MNIHTNHPQLFHIFLRYTAFSVLGMLGLSGYILADTFFISQGLGAGGLAALNLAIPVYNFIHGIGLMLGMGAATKYSIYLSHGDRRHADVIFTNTLYLAAAFAIAFMTAGIFFSELITRLLGADEEIFRMTNTYLKVLLRIIRTKLHGDLTMQTFSLGFPSLIAQLSSGIVMIAFNMMILKLAAYGLRLYFTAGAFAGFNTILSVFFTSTENALPAHILSLLRGLVIILPMVFLFASLWGITGVWMAYPAAEFCVAAISLFLYRRNAIPPGGLYAS